MYKYKFFLFSIFLTFSICTHAALRDVVSAEVSIKSTYIHQGTGKKLLNFGNGVHVLYIKNPKSSKPIVKSFVVTAAHVSGGSDLQVKVAGEPVSIIGSLSYSRKDIHIIEVSRPKNSSPLAICVEGFNSCVNRFVRLTDTSYSSFGNEAVKPFNIGNSYSDSNFFQNGALLNPPFIAMPLSFKNPKAKDFSERTAGGLARTIFENFVGDLVFRAKVAPGMSGSGIFVQDAIKNSIIREDKLIAVVSQYSKFQSYSYGAGFKLIPFLIEKYEKGNRGELEEKTAFGNFIKTKWIYDGYGTVREIYDANSFTLISREATLEKAFSGGGTNGDGGGGTNGDGGGGTNGDGGGGTNGSRYSDGLLYNGVHAYFFKVTNLKNNEVIFLQANWAALDFVLFLDKTFKVEALGKNANRFEIIKSRLTNSTEQSFISWNLKMSVEQESTSQLQIKGDVMIDAVPQSSFLLFLSENGIIDGNRNSYSWSSNFIKVSSVNGKSVTADMRDLVALDLGKVKQSPEALGSLSKKWKFLKQNDVITLQVDFN